MICLVASVIAAQGDGRQEPGGLTFEVASVKRNDDPAAPTGVDLSGGRFSVRRATLRELIKMAYPVRGDDQLVGGPEWTGTDRFDVEATGGPADTPRVGAGMVAPPPGAAIDQVRAMLRNLLAERFKLAIHSEQRRLAIFELTRVRPDRLGEQLRPTVVNCATEAPPADRQTLRCGGFRLAGGQLAGRAVTMNALVALLSGLPLIGRPVEDRSGLTGQFDVNVAFSRDGQGADAPSIFTAFVEQLGLRLVPADASGEVFVIDTAEQPTPN